MQRPAAASGASAPLAGPEPRPRRGRNPLLAVGVLYVVAQLALVPPSRAPSWDEAIYLPQVTPGSPALPFVASRARGVTFLVLPVAWLHSMLAVRLFLAVAAAASLLVAFGFWLPVARGAAVLAAALFALSWPAVVYGSEAMPNLWAALFAVASTAAFVRRLERDPRVPAWAAPGTAIRALDRGAPCLVESSEAYPEVAFAARCRGRELSPRAAPPTSSPAGLATFVAVRDRSGPAPAGSPALVAIPDPRGGSWLVWRVPA